MGTAQMVQTYGALGVPSYLNIEENTKFLIPLFIFTFYFLNLLNVYYSFKDTPTTLHKGAQIIINPLKLC